MVVQKDLGDKITNWMKTLQEYSLYIRPSKIVKGQGICKFAAKSTGNKNDEDKLYEDQNLLENELFYIPVNTDP
jgi:hypothetical protein